MINGIGVSGGSLSGIGGKGGVQRGEYVARSTVAGGAAEDRAAVSTIFSQIAAAGPPIDADRVAALRAAIKAGTYRADPQAIAGKMIDTDLGRSAS